MLASLIVLAVVLIVFVVFHAWSASQWNRERAEMFREITNLAVSRGPTDLKILRSEPKEADLISPWPDGYENPVGL